MARRQLIVEYCFLLAAAILYDPVEGRFLLRARRETGEGGNEAGENGNRGSLGLPLTENSHPYPSIGSDTLAPSFPFTHSFTNGMDINRGDIAEMSGRLNIPVPGWGLWDLRGHQVAGPSHTWYHYGHFLSPADPFHMGPSAMAQISNDAINRAQAERASASPGAQSVPVVRLPTGFSPFQCKPPMCNPFVHSFDVGTQVEPGDETIYDGSLDFPYQAKDGTVRRFPLSGGFISGLQPVSVLYGQAMNPVNPFPSLDRANKWKLDQTTHVNPISQLGQDRYYGASDNTFHSNSTSNENSVHIDSTPYKPFLLPSADNHAHSNGLHYFHGNQGLVTPPDFPVAQSRDSALSPTSMPKFPSLTASRGRT